MPHCRIKPHYKFTGKMAERTCQLALAASQLRLAIRMLHDVGWPWHGTTGLFQHITPHVKHKLTITMTIVSRS